jgi:hypothetical protein
VLKPGPSQVYSVKEVIKQQERDHLIYINTTIATSNTAIMISEQACNE